MPRLRREQQLNSEARIYSEWCSIKLKEAILTATNTKIITLDEIEERASNQKAYQDSDKNSKADTRKPVQPFGKQDLLGLCRFPNYYPLGFPPLEEKEK